jgi:Transporter associated domain
VRLGLKEPQEQRFGTVSGLVLSRLEYGPQPGARVSYDGWYFEILEVDGTRIEKLRSFASKEQDQLCSNVSALNFDGQDARLPEVQIAFSVGQTAEWGFVRRNHEAGLLRPRPSTSSASTETRA